MGVRYPSVATNAFIGPLPANANETIVLTTPPIILPLDGAVVMLAFSCDITAGTSVTRHVWVLRRGATLSGANIYGTGGHVTIETAGVRNVGSDVYVDFVTGAAGPLQYSLTVAQTGATVAGSFVDGSLLAFIL